MKYQDFFKEAEKNNINQIQITEITDISKSISYIDDMLDNNDVSKTISYKIKAEKNGKTVKLSTDYLDKSIIDLLDLKFGNTDTKYEDEYLFDKSHNNLEQIENISIVEKDEELKNIFELKKLNSNLKKISTTLNANSSKIRIINSNGVDISSASKCFSLYCEVVLENKKDIISYSKNILKTDLKDIKIKDCVEDTIKEAELMLTKKKLESKKYNILIRNDIASSIINNLIQSLTADNIRLKMSFLENKLNEKVFSDKITLIEDPLNKNYPGYRLFDDEGVFTSKKTIIDKGYLKNYLYNIKEAKLANTESTGNCFGNISTRNLFLNKGNIPESEIIRNIEDGIYITDFMGAQNTSMDINTGSISLQIFGFIIKNGKIVSGFEPCIMTTSFFELFNNVIEIADNLEFFYKSVGAPSILLKDISIVS